MAGMTIRSTENGTSRVYFLEGAIDDVADYSAVNFAGVTEAIFDFTGVTQINSVGIQRWIKFINAIPVGSSVVFRNCTLKIVNQLNLFPGIAGIRGARIESFDIPYFCEACDDATALRVCTPDALTAIKAGKIPEVTCEQCKGPLEFDGVESKFFSFLKAG